MSTGDHEDTKDNHPVTGQGLGTIWGLQTEVLFRPGGSRYHSTKPRGPLSRLRLPRERRLWPLKPQPSHSNTFHHILGARPWGDWHKNKVPRGNPVAEHLSSMCGTLKLILCTTKGKIKKIRTVSAVNFLAPKHEGKLKCHQ